MNIFIATMLLFCLLGLLDKILNNRLGLQDAFDDGLKTIGSIALSMSGFYCIAIFFIQNNVESFLAISENLPIDSTVLIGSILAPDMGGFSIVDGISNTSSLVVFSGILLTSTLGATISFQMPIFLGSLKKEELPVMVQGLMYGIITLPFILILSAIYLQIPNIILNLLPIIVLCIILFIGLTFFYKQTIALLTLFANFIKALSIVFFAMVTLQLYIPSLQFTTPALIEEAMVIVIKMGIIVCGSMVLCHLILKYADTQIKKIANKLGCNDVSIVGLLLSFTTSLAMLPLFSKMDTKGKLMNAAFSVSGAYVLGGQLGFVSSITTNENVLLYILVKVSAGILAIAFAFLFTKKKDC